MPLQVLAVKVAHRVAHLNRYRRQVEGGTPVSTLQVNAQQEGSQVLELLERHSQSVLQAHGFDAQGQPSAAQVAQAAANTYYCLSVERIEQGLTAVCQEMQARGFSPEQIARVRTQTAGAVYEDPVQCTNVAIDDIEVKKQKAHREHPTTPATELATRERASLSESKASSGLFDK